MTTENLVNDVVILPIKDHPVQRNVVTSKYDVDYVMEVNKPDQCIVSINGEKFNIELTAQKASELIYGGIGE